MHGESSGGDMTVSAPNTSSEAKFVSTCESHLFIKYVDKAT